MAYAMNHMGVDYPDLRKFAEGKIWDSQADSVQAVKDASAFRFLTNFVKYKRRIDG
jgi:hypothetical protein